FESRFPLQVLHFLISSLSYRFSAYVHTFLNRLIHSLKTGHLHLSGNVMKKIVFQDIEIKR
ncbi:hypothetical protein MRP14_15805, partial [Dickeya dianthicola]|uniref:hypothetical protein n=1 Tax=Dickeya dianthicola TaxID=204039 RepID=UPI001F601E1C